MKKKILIIGNDSGELYSAINSLNHSCDFIAADAIDAFKSIVIKKKRSVGLSTMQPQIDLPFVLYAPEIYEMPNIDPCLPWPKSFQDPKGEKTGTKVSGLSNAKRRKLKSKRKNKRKK